jgi:hypothetical protein
MTTPTKAPERTGVIVYSKREAVGRCELLGCLFTCRVINEVMRYAVDDCRKSLQNHMNRAHRMQVHQYFFDLTEDTRPYVK